MPAPTTSILLNSTDPAPPSGNQNVKPQSDGGTPLQSISLYPQPATASLLGVVRPDGTTITVSAAGVLSAAADASAMAGVIGIVIDGAGSVPATGAKGFVQAPYGGVITGWTMIADQSGSAQITVSMGTYAAFPTVASIVASAPPNLAGAQNNTSAALTGWTTAFSAGDVFSFHLDSVATCTRIVLELQVTKA